MRRRPPRQVGRMVETVFGCKWSLTVLDLLAKRSFPEVPPRVEYALTPFGERFSQVLERLDELEGELAADAQATVSPLELEDTTRP